MHKIKIRIEERNQQIACITINQVDVKQFWVEKRGKQVFPIINFVDIHPTPPYPTPLKSTILTSSNFKPLEQYKKSKVKSSCI